MLLTEKLAKTKTCPFIAFANWSPNSSGPPVYQHQTCQGSDCAGWRWTGKFTPGDAPADERKLGYCGPAGRPIRP